MAETADNSTTTQTQEIKTPTKIGKVERVTMTFPQEGMEQQNNQTDHQTDIVNEGADATNDANKAVVVDKTTAAPTFTDEQLKAYFQSVGIEFDGVEKLKEKLTAPTTQAQPTEEQIKAQEIAKEKRVIDKFISGGGTWDQYTALKSVANADVAELSKNTLRNELKDAGFNETEIDGIIKERYYQFGDEDLEQMDEETDKAFAKRKKEYGDKLLSNRSLPIKNQAAGILKGIQDAINSEDLQAQQEVAFSAKIDEDFKALPRKLNIEIGEIGGKTVSPVYYDVDEEIVAQVKATLKDPAQRQQLLFNQDGTLNITKIAEAFVKAKSFDSAAKISYLESQTRNNALWMEKFGARTAQELGVGGSQQRTNGQNGSKIAGVGKVQRVQPQRQ